MVGLYVLNVVIVNVVLVDVTMVSIPRKARSPETAHVKLLGWYVMDEKVAAPLGEICAAGGVNHAVDAHVLVSSTVQATEYGVAEVTSGPHDTIVDAGTCPVTVLVGSI